MVFPHETSMSIDRRGSSGPVGGKAKVAEGEQVEEGDGGVFFVFCFFGARWLHEKASVNRSAAQESVS